MVYVKRYKTELREFSFLDKICCDICEKELVLHQYYNYRFFKLEHNGILLEDVIRDICYECGNNEQILKEYREKLREEL